MSRATREQRERNKAEKRAADKEKRMRSPSGKSSYAHKKKLQQDGQHPKVTDGMKRVPLQSFEDAPISNSPWGFVDAANRQVSPHFHSGFERNLTGATFAGSSFPRGSSRFGF